MTALLKEEHYLTPEEYLEFEEASEVRHEYINGYVEAMAGGSWAHRTICTNVLVTLGGQLRGTPCVPHTADARVRIRLPNRNFYYYPDVVVDCSGVREVETDEPSVIFEVLSDSTKRADHGEKRLNYLNLASMQVYVLIDQGRVQLTVHRRVQADSWAVEVLTDLEANLFLPEIGCTLALREIYDRLDFASS